MQADETRVGVTTQVHLHGCAESQSLTQARDREIDVVEPAPQPMPFEMDRMTGAGQRDAVSHGRPR